MTKDEIKEKFKRDLSDQIHRLNRDLLNSQFANVTMGYTAYQLSQAQQNAIQEFTDYIDANR